ncbi:MAG: Alkaline phosphatase superfamily protein [Bacillales bacterium]|nr:Alkaline phosphatase superfamily protein [Bacillales bacterium]
MKNITKSNLWPILLASVLVWIKTYLITRFTFDVELENFMQEFIYFISTLSTSLVVFGLALFSSGKKRIYTIMVLTFIFSFILTANTIFYAFYDDFITVPVLFQSSNMADLGTSIAELINFKTFLGFTDLFILAIYFHFTKNTLNLEPVVRKMKSSFYMSIVILVIFNLGLAETERPQLLTRSFDRKVLVKNIGLYNFHIYDIAIQSRTTAQKALADSTELVDIENYVEANTKKPRPEMQGIAKGKNVIIVSMESLQDFTIGSKINGQEVTPFLNQFIKESYYFNNFYHQTGQGKTSDAEFIIDNSLYPLDRGAVFFTHPNNKYLATPEILKQNGYYSAVFHANNKSFWNRDVIYKTFKYDRFFDVEEYNVTPENSISWGLKDKEFFDQSVDMLKNIPQPFYAKFLTLTNHFPFLLSEEDKTIEEYNSGDKVVDKYFTTVRYLDESLKQFVQKLKDEGLYENSIIVFYGDHYGISENHNAAMEMYLGKPITKFETVQLQKVPFLIHIPNQKKGQTISTVSGQVDIRPTLLNLLGIESKDLIQFGNDLFAPDKYPFTVFRNGSFVTDKYIYTDNKCYDKSNAIEIEKEACGPYVEKAKQELQYSDKIIYGDLLRFYGKEK